MKRDINFSLAPIVLFSYKRLDTLKQTVTALQYNYLASKSDLIIYSDGPKNEIDSIAVNEVRNYLETVNGFKSVRIVASFNNKGLANSIIEGVTEVLKKHEKVIVLEDDLVSSPNFLDYMNDALFFYQDDLRVFSISGFSIPIKSNETFGVYFTKRASSWGWATWQYQWANIDWEVKDYEKFKFNFRRRYEFNKMGSDLSGMLDKQMRGKLNSWAIRWCYHQFKYDLFSVHPIISKISNIGFSIEASNTKEKYSRYTTELDNRNLVDFKFNKQVKMNKDFINQFIKPFSILTRIKYKLINKF